MEEIKVGEYVRTKNGIAKIINVEENPHKEKTIYVLDKNIISIEDAKYGIFHLTVNPLAEEMTNKFDTHFGDEKQILKHSKNPIDIIEEGDYVNGDRIDIVEKMKMDTHIICKIVNCLV